MTRAELLARNTVTAEEGAAFLGLSLSTWKRIERDGQLPTHRLPNLGTRTRRYCAESLARFGTPKDLQDRARKALKGLQP